MKIVRYAVITGIPASHEDAKDPGVMKKILLMRKDLFDGRIQMINWATLLPGKVMKKHFHTDMQEVFIMLGDGAIARIDAKEISLSRGDALVVDAKETHEMKNQGLTPIEFIVLGIA